MSETMRDEHEQTRHEEATRPQGAKPLDTYEQLIQTEEAVNMMPGLHPRELHELLPEMTTDRLNKRLERLHTEGRIDRTGKTSAIRYWPRGQAPKEGQVSEPMQAQTENAKYVPAPSKKETVDVAAPVMNGAVLIIDGKLYRVRLEAVD